MMEYTKEELLEARRQIDSTLHKLRSTIVTLRSKENPARYKSQITLAQRRMRAFEIAVGLIEERVSLEVWTCIILLGYFDGNSHQIRIGNARNPTS